MKRLISIVAMVMVMFWCGSAMAVTGTEGCPDGNIHAFQMPEQYESGQNECIGRVELSDLGQFIDGVFVWNGPMSDAVNDKDINTPTQGVQPVYSRFDVRTFPDGRRDSRIVYQGGLVLTIPMVWLVKGPNGETSGYYMSWPLPPEGCENDDPYMNNQLCAQDFPQYAEVQTYGSCDNAINEQFCGTYDVDGIPQCDPGPPQTKCSPESQLYSCYDLFELGFTPVEVCSPIVFWNVGNPEMNANRDVPACCKMWTKLSTETIILDALTASDFTGVSWNGLDAGVEGSYKSDYVFLQYDTNSNELFDTGWGTRQTDPEVYFAPFAAVPAEPGPQTVNFSMADGTSFSMTFEVPSVEVMPTVAAKSYYTQLVAEDEKGKSKSKKKVKATEMTVEVDNLIARELEGALVIQWAEPEGALNRPNMKLRMYVGDSWDLPNGSYEYDTFIFADCPVQTGTVVIPAHIWGAFKQKMLDIGYSDVTVAGMYRYQTPGGQTQSHNRGYFESIKFPIQ